MDDFDADDMFADFNTDSIIEIPKENPPSPIDNKRKKPKFDDNRVNDATKEKSDPTIRNVTTSSNVEEADGEIDYFSGYFPQTIVGSAKPEKPSIPGEKTCAMQTCYPPNWDIEAEEAKVVHIKREPAKQYPFTLDPFQQNAINCIEKNESILVSAHTSAGKTVVAEYAIALSLKLGQRVIYTSPIKALSNQKYRELQEEFTDVGLMTGDITINPDASCLVMTTEILRNMLYRGSEVLRELAWVVFDEIHYMRDRSRGVVWEETIISLPDKCRFVFLSATIPNAAEFACWVAKIHRQPCSVVYTEYRPTPLEHHVFPQGGKGLYLVYDKQGNFRDNNFQRAISVMQSSQDTVEKGTAKDKKKKDTGKDDVFKIIKMIMEKELQPCVVFSFSKKDCETHAANMAKLDFCNDDERELISQIFHNAIESLTEDDKKLPQVVNIYPLLKRGVGVHHGGLLPILKEVIEILFQEGLLKVLFATETFAMGLNMPARTVVFTSVFKWDGISHRPLTSGEYIQMSGRAGRRGLDDKGMVIMMMDQQLEASVAKEMITGAADPLHSSFHLGYNMLLNLLRVEEANPEFMMTRSFFQFQQQRAVPHIQQAIDALRLQNDEINNTINSWGKKMDSNSIVNIDAPTITDVTGKEAYQYVALTNELDELKYKLRKVTTKPDVIQPVINPGRLIRVRGLIRQGPPPPPGSAAALAAKPSLLSIKINESVDKLKLENKAVIALENLQEHPSLKMKTQATSSVSTSQVINNTAASDSTLSAPPGLGNPPLTYNSEIEWGWGVVLNINKKLIPPSCIHGAFTHIPPHTTQRGAVGIHALVVDVLLPVLNPQTNGNYGLGVNTIPWTKESGEKPEYVIVPIVLSAIAGLSKMRIRTPTSSDAAACIHLGLQMQEALRRIKAKNVVSGVWSHDSIEIFNPSDFKTLETSPELTALVNRIETTFNKVTKHKIHSHEHAHYICTQLAHKSCITGYIDWLQIKLAELSQDSGLKNTLHGMKRVLRSLAQTDSNDVITSKGRVACELSTCDELLGTDLIYGSVFNDLNESQICALLSCLVFDEPHDDQVPTLTDELHQAHKRLQEMAKSIGKVVVECRLPLDIDKFVSSFNPFLMEVVSAWCDGAKFSDICVMTDAFEGTIIRVMRRLEELLRQMAAAAAAIGNDDLELKFKQCTEKLKRDIVFAASLYL